MRRAATTKAGGKCFVAPNVCKVPSPAGPVPTPMASQASPSTASKTIKKVLVEKKEVCVETSQMKSSSGDEAGTLKGVVSSTQGGAVQFKGHSSKVYARNKKMVHHLARTSHNGSNANVPVGSHVTASQSRVMIG